MRLEQNKRLMCYKNKKNMSKIKISKEDLELNIEVTGSENPLKTVPVTHICGATRSTCGNFTEEDPCQCTVDKRETCDTGTTDESETFCQTDIPDDKCLLSYGCMTKKCESDICADSDSQAEQCCVITKQDTCQETVDGCATNAYCGNTNDICIETQYDTCIKPASWNIDNCIVPSV